MKISIIVAMAENRAIGLNNAIPWHLSADLKNFKKITLGKPILMGRKTHESIGKPLPGRENIIISRNPDYRSSGVRVFNSIDAALQHLKQHQEVMIIGGAGLYQAMLPRASYLYLTQIHQCFPADTFFPEFVITQWRELERKDITADDSVAFDYSFIKLEKNNSR